MAIPTDIELLQPNETILNGQYTIEKHLGNGGQGQVYLARHRIFEQVAIKRLHRHIAAESEGLSRFERELRITHQLRGEHVIFIRHFDQDPARDEWFSVMEYANAGSLKDKLDTEAPLPVTEAIDLAKNLCQALAHIHQYPYVHGDLKPSNILFHASKIGKFVLKLSDFGSAFPPVQAGVLPLPSGLKTARTQLYVSPELLDASDPEDTEALKVDVDQRADIYAVGVILYEMLTGRPPFWEPSGESEDVMVALERQHALFQKIKHQDPREPRRKRSEILPALNDLVIKALAKNPTDRFLDVDEMRASLDEILHEEEARLAELDRLRPLADQALTEKQWGQAIDLLYKILDKAPNDPDASQKLKTAEDQHRLMSLRHRIPRKMNEEQWPEGRNLVEEALEIAPDDTTLTTWQKEIDDQMAIIEILTQAEEVAKEDNWLEVIRFCLKALELDPGHIEASDLLSRAQTRHRIARLRQEIDRLHEEGDKQGELKKLKELLEIVPTDRKIEARIEAVEREIKLETFYSQGVKAYKEERWEDAVEALQKVLDIDSFYRQGEHSAAVLKADAEKKLAENAKAPEQKEKHSPTFPRLFQIFIPFLARIQEIWLRITHGTTLALVGILLAAASCIAAVLAIPGILELVTPPSIDEVQIVIDGDQIESSVDNESIYLTELPSLVSGERVEFEVRLNDVDGNIFSGNDDLRCNWTFAPVYDEVIGPCKILYTPLQNYSRLLVSVTVEGAKQDLGYIPPISMEFKIENN